MNRAGEWMAYWRLHYHLVWATYRREPLLTREIEDLVHRTLYGKAKELGLLIHALGGMDDHIHAVVSIPPALAIADCVGKLKGASSHRVNEEVEDHRFRWQGGYGALTIGARSLATVIAYVRNQRRHHDTGRTVAIYERHDEEDDGVVVNGYVERRR